MEKGKQIYLTEKEIEAVLSTCTEWADMMAEGEETNYLVKERLQEGLGSAIRKIGIGRRIAGFYGKYKTVR